MHEKCKIKKEWFIVLVIMLWAGSVPAHAQKGWKDLSPQKFHQHQQTHPDALILDTRMIEKYRRERIPGALAAPRTKVLKAITDTLAADRQLMIYCGEDERSTYVCRLLTKEMGFSRVFRLKGGLYRWKKENLPVDTTAAPAGSGHEYL